MAQRRPLAVDPIAEARRQWVAHGWEHAAEGVAVVTSLMRAQQLVQARVDAALKPFALSFARYELLRLLAFSRDHALPMSSVTARLQVHPTSVTSTVDRLERDDLVRRQRHPRDGRAVMLALTEAGADIVEQATHALNSEVFSDLPLEQADAGELVAIVARMRHEAGDYREG